MATNIGLDKHPAINQFKAVSSTFTCAASGVQSGCNTGYPTSEPVLAHRDKNMTRMGFTFGHPYDKCYITALIF